MPVFVCSECQTIENTATSNWLFRHVEKLPALCSACDPAIGKWHGVFERVTYDPAKHGELKPI